MSDFVYKLLTDVLPWLPTIIFGVCILFAFFSGLRRGFSKSLKLFITFLLAILISFIFFIVIKNNFDTISVKFADWILSFSGSSLQQKLNTTGTYSTLTQYLEEYLSKNEKIKEYVQSNNLTIQEVTKLIYSFALIIVNICLAITCIVVFFIAKAILYIFYLIFAREGRKKKKINRAFAEKRRDKPYKPHRIAGSFVGLLRGLIVGIFLMIPFGTLNLIVANNVSNIEYNTDKRDSTAAIAEVVDAINQYSTKGVGKILTSVKNPEGMPIYLIVADKLLSTEYVYKDENGQDVKLDLTLSKDIAPLTGFICNVSFQFLQYGYDINKQYTSDELIEFITSDKEIDGLTLEEKIKSLIESVGVEEKSLIGYVSDVFVISFVDKYVGEDVNDENISNQEISKKMLYHLFLGQNSLKSTEILAKGNLSQVFDIMVTVLKNKDTFVAINNTFNNNNNKINKSLAFGVEEASSENISKGKELMREINEDLSRLSFYDTTKFNNLISDLVKDTLEEAVPQFDLTTTTGQDMYDVMWTNSIEEVFSFVGKCIDIIVDNRFNNSADFMSHCLTELGDTNSELYDGFKKILDSEGVSIVLNTVGFNSLVENTINDSLSSFIGDEKITFVDTNWATYKDSNGNVIKGEISKILDTIMPSVAKLYTIFISSDNGNLAEKDYKEIIDILTDKNSSIFDLLETNNENHSNLIHAFLSDVFKAKFITYEDQRFGLYVPSNCLEEIDVRTGNYDVISSDSFKEIFDFLNQISDDAFDIKNGSADAINLIEKYSNSIKESDLILANISNILYRFGQKYLTIPQKLSLEDDVIDDNISQWTKENGEMSKLIDIVKNFSQIIHSIQSQSDTSKLMALVVKDGGATINSLSDSLIVNATITAKIKEVTNNTDLKIYIPDEAYNDSNHDTIKKNEFVQTIRYIKKIYDVDDSATSLDLKDFKYQRLLDKDAIEILLDSTIMVSTIAYFVRDHIVSNPNVSKYLVIPNDLLADLNEETILSNYSNTNWDNELSALLTNLSLIGLNINPQNEVVVDTRRILYLGEPNETDNTRTNISLLYESSILSHSLSKTISNIDTIYVPLSSYDGEIIKETELGNTIHAFFELIGLENISSQQFDIDNIKDYIDLTRIGNIQTLENLVKPNIVNATIANMIITKTDSSNIITPNEFVFNKNDETNLIKWLYQDDSNKGETIKLIDSINSLNLLNNITSGDVVVNISDVLDLSDTNIDILTNSSIMEATIIDYIVNNKSNAIYIPTDYQISTDLLIANYSSCKFVTENEINKMIKGLARIGNAFSNLAFNFNLIEGFLENDSNNVKKLDTILNSYVLWYSISNYCMQVNDINISKSTITSILDNNYITKEEIELLIESLNMLNISDFNDINYNSILSIDNVNNFLNSTTIWYTISNKMFNVSTITLTENEIEIKNEDELFIYKDELLAFVQGVKLLTTSNDLDNISIEPNNVVANIDSLIDSSIIRTLITKEIINSNNDIVIERTNLSTNETETFASLFRKFENNNLSNDAVCQLTKEEIIEFKNAIVLIFGTNSVSFEIDYQSINFTTINQSILDSTIILAGLQTNLRNGITCYNAGRSEEDKVKLTNDYSYRVYNLNSDTTYEDYISKEEANNFITKIHN